MSINEKIVQLAQAYVGLSAAPSTLPFFEDLLGGPGESPEMKRDMCTAPGSSTCGLFVRAVFREIDIAPDPTLHAPYRVSMAIADLETLAIRRGALVAAVPGLRPEPGDVVGVGMRGLNAGRHAHVFIVRHVDGNTLSSIDGGQVDKQGRQMIALKSRTWREAGGVIYDSSRLIDPRLGFDSYDEREVSWWISVRKLAQIGGAP